MRRRVMRRVWVSHLTHIWMSHVTHMNESCHTYEWVMSHIWMSHASCVSESPCEWVMHIGHGIHANDSWYTCEGVMALIPRRLGTHMNEALYTYEWVIAHIWMSHAHMSMSHATHINESLHACDCVMTIKHRCRWVMGHGAHDPWIRHTRPHCNTLLCVMN